MSSNGSNGANGNGHSNGNGQKHLSQTHWSNDPRWYGVTRPYSYSDVLRLRGSIQIEYTLAKLGAERLWNLMQTDEYVPALGAITGNQAIEMVQAGLKAIYGSGWQVAADGNTAGDVYPDQSLYPSDSAPNLVKRLNRALLRADQIESAEGKKSGTHWFAPIVADAEAGFGGSLNAYELMKAMIEAGAAGVHFEDQLSSAKKCGHLGGKVVVPIREFIEKLIAARLAADVCGVPTILIARTDADSAGLLLSDADPRDREFIYGERTPEGFYQFHGGIDAAIARGLAYAPYADMIWCETSHPDLGEAKKFAEAIHAKFPGKLLAYNCSPSFNWKKKLDDVTIANFQQELGQDGLQIPVRHAGRLPRAEHVHVPPRARLRAGRYDGVFETSAGRICRAGTRLPRRHAPALRRHRLFRRNRPGGFQRQFIHHRPGRLDRNGSIPWGC